MGASSVRGDLFTRMVALRRVAALSGLAGSLVHSLFAARGAPLGRVALVLAVIAAYNEVGYLLSRRNGHRHRGLVANTQIALDTIGLTVLLHFYGSGLGQVGVVFFAPAFFVYGAVLPLPQALAHVALTTLELTLLGTAERGRWVPLYAVGFFGAGLHTLAVSVAQFTLVNGCCCYLSHYLTSLLRREKAHSHELEVGKRDESARVQTLLEVADRASFADSVGALLQAVCDATVRLFAVPRITVFLWDVEEQRLCFAAARGGGSDGVPQDRGVPPWLAGDVSLGRLRTGSAVHADHAAERREPGRSRIGDFAVPMICRGWFEGVLLVTVANPSPELVQLAHGIARQAALAMVNVRTLEKRQEDAEIARVLLELSRTLGGCLNEETLWRQLAHTAGTTLNLPWVIVARSDHGSSDFRVAGAHGMPEDLLPPPDARLGVEHFPILVETIAGRELTMAAGETRSPLGLPGSSRVGSWIAIPLASETWQAGVIVAGRLESRAPFTRRELRLAEGLRHHASTALHNAHVVATLEAADRLKSEFVSTISHELRTPLNVILGYTEMLRDDSLGSLTAQQRDVIERLGTRGRELLALVEATLHVARLESGEQALELAPCLLSALLHALRSTTEGLPRARPVALEWHVPHDTGQVVTTDRAKLLLIVRNLVGNALKFTPEGRVTVRIALHAGSLAIQVEDTGVGIEGKDLPIIFDRFRQVDGSETRRHDGVGLGLYLVKQFVARLGGTIDVSSTLGQGTTFRVVLPGAVRDEGRAAA